MADILLTRLATSKQAMFVDHAVMSFETWTLSHRHARKLQGRVLEGISIDLRQVRVTDGSSESRPDHRPGNLRDELWRINAKRIALRCRCAVAELTTNEQRARSKRYTENADALQLYLQVDTTEQRNLRIGGSERCSATQLRGPELRPGICRSG